MESSLSSLLARPYLDQSTCVMTTDDPWMDTAASRARRSRRVHIDDRSVCQGVRPTTDELMRPAGVPFYPSACRIWTMMH
ncbi:hypothetical protein PVAP13_8KG284000 [Panicum virgatum]|uniref:Uncharacterized protein n=1 Tax=Panicum virgatum TaxID=38727 RepID=A0A8T0PQC2_PANVG|nr:hypothetical protein PVAP13_8KG284000 [Panicum virgatum]